MSYEDIPIMGGVAAQLIARWKDDVALERFPPDHETHSHLSRPGRLAGFLLLQPKWNSGYGLAIRPL